MPRQGGFSLLEVLISSTLLAATLLGLAGLTLSGMEDAAASRDELVAAILMRDIAGSLVLAGHAPGEIPTSGFAQREIRQWQERVRAALPDAEGVVCLDSTPDDGRPALPACDGTGAPVTKVLWVQPSSGEPERRVQGLGE